MRFSSAISTTAELTEACHEVARQVREDMDGKSIDLCMAFVSAHFASKAPQVPPLLQEILGPKTLVGCSGGGIIGHDLEIEQQPAFSLLAAHLPDVDIVVRHLSDADLPDGDAGQSGWTEMTGIQPEDAAGFLVLPEPFSFSTNSLLSGLDFAYPHCLKVGGVASGAPRPGGNFLFKDQSCLRQGAVLVGFSGNIVMDSVVAQGCKPIGAVGKITKAHQNLLHKINDKPALTFLQEQLQQEGDLQPNQDVPLFLGIAMDPFESMPEQGDFLIRNMQGYDPSTGSLAVGEFLSVGRPVQFHVRDGESSDQDLRDVLGQIQKRGAIGYRGAFLFSCLGRGKNLYGEDHHDTRLFHEYVGDVPLAGMFCNGEIGPVQNTTYLHGYTSAFALFREKRA